MKNKSETISKSINGNLTTPQTEKMRICFNYFDDIQTHIAALESVILD